MYSCRIIADSMSPVGKRLTTIEVCYPRMVHSELLTHRMFSRNSSSSRAIPIEKMIEQVMTDPAAPVWWGKNQRGMQAREELTGSALALSQYEWLKARDSAVDHARHLMQYEAHKQIVNRLLEPWMWITVLVSSTEWANFFRLRCHADAQPEIQKAAYLIRDEWNANAPVVRTHHLPFHDPERDADVEVGFLARVCVARCARVSYLTHDGRRDWRHDASLAATLASSGHWSPFEHVANACPDPKTRIGNFIGWAQFRSEVDPDFIRFN